METNVANETKELQENKGKEMEMEEMVDDLELEDFEDELEEINEEIEDEDDEKYCYCADCGARILIEDSYTNANGDYICGECKDNNYIECYECGDLVRRDYATYADDIGEYFCESCKENCLEWCDNCETWNYYKDDFNSVHTRYGEQWWCSTCTDNGAFYCCGYEEYFSTNDYEYYEVNGDLYCENYCNDNFNWCDRCDSYVRYDDWNERQNCCCGCADDESQYVKAYHDRPYLQFFGRKERLENDKRYNEDTQACGGLELEIDREDEDIEAIDNVCEYIINNTKDNEIYFNQDGSLEHGFEIITQPHTIEALYNINWKGILQKCIDEGFKSHDIETCGLHMHISRDFFGRTKAKQSTAIAKLISFYDANYKEIVKVARRSMDRAYQWAGKHDTDNSNNPHKQAYDLAKGKVNAGRYKAVNLKNYSTIEFRIMRGTLKYETFIACIDFLYTIAKNSRTIKWKDLYRLDLWFKGMRPETIEYIKSRNAFTEHFNNINITNNNGVAVNTAMPF